MKVILFLQGNDRARREERVGGGRGGSNGSLDKRLHGGSREREKKGLSEMMCCLRQEIIPF